MRVALLGTALAALAFAARPATAANTASGTSAVVLPTVTPAEDCATCPAPHRPDPEAERQLALLGRELDSVMVDAAQDLGLVIDISARPSEEPPTRQSLVERAATGWVFSPRISPAGQHVVLRIVAVPPGSRVELARSEKIKPQDLEVRAVLMLRDLVDVVKQAPPQGPEAPRRAPDEGVVERARSRGGAVLALNAAVLGGFVGYSLQRAGGSNDARLTYPLIALGAGLGIGGSMIVSEEWDVGVGDAWYLSAGAWWPLLGGVLIADSSGASQNRRFLYGAGAAASGLALATTSLAFGAMSEGGALIAHSGGAFGTALGGLTELIVRGNTDTTPRLGMGLGSIVGVVSAGTFARFAAKQAPSRVLLVDLAAGLGALTGAAVASPLIFGDDIGATRERLWLSSIALGTFVGAGVGLLMTPARPRDHESAIRVTPTAGVIDAVKNPDGSTVPVTGIGARGVF